MIEEQRTIPVRSEELVAQVTELFRSGHRLVQIGCTKVEGFEMNYSFAKEYGFLNLRLLVPSLEAEVPSISGVYWNAFLYENEIHDLFGLKIKGIVIDYKGSFYRTEIKMPFNSPKPQDTGEGA